MVSLQRLFHKTIFICEKYPHSSGSNYSLLCRNSQKLQMKYGFWLVGSTLKKQLITHVVFVQTIIRVIMGSLYFLDQESDSSGACVRYLIIYFGNSGETEMQSNSLGLYDLSISMNSGQSRSCQSVGLLSISCSSLRLVSEQVLYQLIFHYYYYKVKHYNQIDMQSFYYLFEIQIQRVYIDITFPCSVQIRIRKGKSTSNTKGIKIQQNIHFIDFNDLINLKLKARLFEGRFQPQQTKLQVLIYPQNSSEIKLGGEIQKFDMADVLSPQRKRESGFKKYQIPLQRSHNNGRILFTVNWKYLNDCHEESLADVSFQNPSNSPFNLSTTTDMTFRPPKDNNNNDNRRNTSRQREELNSQSKSPLNQRVEPRPEYRQQRINSRETRQTNNYRESVKYDNREIRAESRNQPKQQIPISRAEQPMGFSFGPFIPPEREKQILDNLNEISRQLNEKKRECQRLQIALKTAQSQRGGIDEKKLQLINELNSSITQVQQLKRDKNEMNNQLNKLRQEIRELQVTNTKLRQENKELNNNFNRMRQENSFQLQEITQRGEFKRKELDQLKMKYQKILRQNEQMKQDLFRKQSQLISSQNHAEQIKNQYLSKSIPIMEELKRVNQDLGRQKAQLERKFIDLRNQLDGEKQFRFEGQKKLAALNEELQKQRENKKTLIQAFQMKEKQNQQQLAALEHEMSHLFGEETAEKEQQIQQLRKRLAEQSKRAEQSSKKAQQLQREMESQQIQVSELKVKIKHLEQTCVNLERDYTQKQREVTEKQRECHEKGMFIQKVRQYVSKIEADNAEKQLAIKERDQFIAKAKEFISAREKELLAQIEKAKKENQGVNRGQIQKLKADISNLMMQASKRESFIAGLVQQGNTLQHRLQEADYRIESAEHRANELEQYAGHLQERLEITQQEMQELVRKTRSQEETLSSMVKKELQMQMQINVLNFRLNSFTSVRNI